MITSFEMALAMGDEVTITTKMGNTYAGGVFNVTDDTVTLIQGGSLKYYRTIALDTIESFKTRVMILPSLDLPPDSGHKGGAAHAN